MNQQPPVIALTPGEPAGVGPELALQLRKTAGNIRLVLIADPELLQQRARQLGIRLDLPAWQNQSQPGIYVQPVALNCASTPGRLDTENADYVLDTLDVAVKGCLAGEFAALVTGPVHKAVINEAGHRFSGHTEYLAAQAGVNRVVMMLAGGNLKVALATTHLPLTEVPTAITRQSLTETVRILDQDLRNRFGIAQPVISVCGLNPHAGEQGHLGREEIEVIEPVIKSLSDDGMNLIGPLPADTAFTNSALQDVDAVLAMYHDQGLPVLKHASFGKAVNITLGLPFVRTSVDHGTALALAGSGQASADSLIEALQLATRLSRP